MSFELLERAIDHALAMPLDERHHLAKIIAKSGATYGWEAIENPRRVFR